MRSSEPMMSRLAILLLLVTLGLGGCASLTGSDKATGEQSDALQQQFADAVALKRAGDLDAARASFLALSQARPEWTGPLANLGLIAQAEGDRAQAETYFKQVLGLDPMHPHANNALGVLARKQGQFAEAEAYYRQALAQHPEFKPALRNLAILLELYQGRLAEALELVERYQALQETPDPQVEDWVFDLKSRIN